MKKRIIVVIREASFKLAQPVYNRYAKQHWGGQSLLELSDDDITTLVKSILKKDSDQRKLYESITNRCYRGAATEISNEDPYFYGYAIRKYKAGYQITITIYWTTEISGFLTVEAFKKGDRDWEITLMH